MITFSDVLIAGCIGSLVSSLLWATWGLPYLKRGIEKEMRAKQNNKQ